jgi:hypothetical protein
MGNFTGDRIASVFLSFMHEQSAINYQTRDGSHVTQFVAMARDSQKSRTLQQKIQESQPKKRNQIFQTLFPFINELVFDQFGNFVFQKLCEYLTNEQQIQLASFFKSNFFEVSEHQISSKVLQKFIECADKKHIEPLFVEAKAQFLQ